MPAQAAGEAPGIYDCFLNIEVLLLYKRIADDSSLVIPAKAGIYFL